MIERPVRKRDIKLSEFNISKAKYMELKYFCMQHEEKKKELKNSYGLNAVSMDGMPRGNQVSSPTEQRAIRNYNLQRDIELVEQSAFEANSDISRYLIKSVAESVPFEYMNVPICRADFYGYRKYFFYILSQKK